MRFCTKSLTFCTVSGAWLALDANLISVVKKFLHFFTFSIADCDIGICIGTPPAVGVALVAEEAVDAAVAMPMGADIVLVWPCADDTT